MRNTIIILLLSLSAMTLFTTCKNPGIDYNTFAITEENIQPEAYKVMVSGEYDFLGEVMSIKLNIGLDEQLTDAESHTMDLDNQSFSITVDSLNPYTSYYYCYVVEFDNHHKLLTDVNTFTTLSTRPIVRNLEIKAIDSTTLKVTCIVDEDFGMAITERGVCWNHTGAPTLNDNHVKEQGNGLGEYTCEITGLEPNFPYFVCAYAKNEMGVSYAEPPLRDDLATPTVTASIITFAQSSVVCRGSIENEGSGPVLQRGIHFGVTPEPDNNWSYVPSIPNNQNVFDVPLDGLLSNTTYYFRAYATNIIGTGYSDIDSLILASDTFTIEVSSSPDEGGEVTGGGNYRIDESCTVTATPATGYEFVNWTEGGVEVSPNASYTFTVTRNRNLVANFSMKYTITATANPSEGGTVSGGGVYLSGTICTLTANPNTGFEFENWTDSNGNVVSFDNPYYHHVTGNQQLRANFIREGFSSINALFSVSYYQKVYFSKGNLQFKASTNTWRFAENQWDYVGNNELGTVYENGVKCDNSLISSSYNGWIDLFGWATSGYHNPSDTQNVDYQPWSSSTGSLSYGPSETSVELTGSFQNYDWGVYNQITTNGTWRTLTNKEWDHIFRVRNASTVNGTPNARFAKARVNNVLGVVLFPDNYTHPSGVEQPTGINGVTDWNGYNYSTDEFALMQAAGAVFLPASGKRSRNEVTELNIGHYWSVTSNNRSTAYDLTFNQDSLTVTPRNRWDGLSVRLVCPAQ